MSVENQADAHAKAEVDPKHVVFLQGAGAGHINPTAPLVAAMTTRGIKVTYFAASAETAMGRGDPVSDGTAEGELVKGAGATLRNYRFDPALAGESRLESQNPMHPGKVFSTLPPLLDDLRSLRPPADVIVYDCFLCLPQLAGKILGIPAVGLIPNTGPTCTAAYEQEMFLEIYEGPRQWVKERYSVDVLDLGVPISSWYSPLLNVVLTCEEFFMGFATEAQKAKFGAAPFHCIGSLVDPQTPRRPPIAGFSMDAIRSARDAGKRVVLMSLGSAVPSLLWTRLPPGGHHGCASGKGFAHLVWKAAFEALGGSAEIVVVMAHGEREDVLEGLTVPENFLPFAAVPQLEVLPLCSAFITHGGMGSVMEAVVYGVPMIVVPVFGDQPDIGDSVERLKMGTTFFREGAQRTLSAESLGKAVAELVDPTTRSGQQCRAAVGSIAAKMAATGGAAKAIELILSVAK